ncbi:TetR/AcrR family transcriptional regulator [Paenibacillus sp. HN-1]|uniref:TetR/AcrR family transcriptional regulator n=1 Tax=Paenibacillus TaxID=44249 RepID=UPI001CA801B7|nr:MULTISPECIES: TetR/AcrR family transcriptional regulator [Paenibacillus]MBY9081137.1 TetR/AcrR family transcriptional regulator [Paenibacillus sp. CGMCC 1.18879]MBY9087174.1 TetR/AcrR family transcriptional regulator [Paenibacillus sinensis]
MNRSDRKETILLLHRNTILNAAEQLFEDRGYAATTMDDIARQAEYSKRTVYLQFSGKEEIHDRLVLKGFTGLKEYLLGEWEPNQSFSAAYKKLCDGLTAFYEASPYQFAGIAEFQTTPLDGKDLPQIKLDIFAVGEEINAALEEMISRGIAQGEVRADIRIKETILIFWSSLSGVILAAHRKSSYIAETMGVTAENLLEYSFGLLLRMLAKEGEIPL